jgi:hypothetical protein
MTKKGTFKTLKVAIAFKSLRSSLASQLASLVLGLNDLRLTQLASLVLFKQVAAQVAAQGRAKRVMKSPWKINMNIPYGNRTRFLALKGPCPTYRRKGPVINFRTWNGNYNKKNLSTIYSSRFATRFARPCILSLKYVFQRLNRLFLKKR